MTFGGREVLRDRPQALTAAAGHLLPLPHKAMSAFETEVARTDAAVAGLQLAGVAFPKCCLIRAKERKADRTRAEPSYFLSPLCCPQRISRRAASIVSFSV
jgi:hypothetical protein